MVVERATAQVLEDSLSSTPHRLIPYAVRTGTRSTLQLLRDNGWNLLVVAGQKLQTHGFQYALDNGAWSSFQNGLPFNVHEFEKAVTKLGDNAEFIVVPDIVEGGLESLRFSESWLPTLDGIGKRRLIAVQDGMTTADVEPILSTEIGIFIGGSTEFKENTMPEWGRVCRDKNAYLHVGRVNSRRRIKLCATCGVHSFDGSSVFKFSSTIHRLTAEVRQRSFIFD